VLTDSIGAIFITKEIEITHEERDGEFELRSTRRVKRGASYGYDLPTPIWEKTMDGEDLGTKPLVRAHASGKSTDTGMQEV
jgi:hypothetical protein